MFLERTCVSSQSCNKKMLLYLVYLSWKDRSGELLKVDTYQNIRGSKVPYLIPFLLVKRKTGGYFTVPPYG